MKPFKNFTQPRIYPTTITGGCLLNSFNYANLNNRPDKTSTPISYVIYSAYNFRDIKRATMIQLND